MRCDLIHDPPRIDRVAMQADSLTVRDRVVRDAGLPRSDAGAFRRGVDACVTCVAYGALLRVPRQTTASSQICYTSNQISSTGFQQAAGEGNI
jgi:hypothetical protein